MGPRLTQPRKCEVHRRQRARAEASMGPRL